MSRLQLCKFPQTEVAKILPREEREREKGNEKTERMKQFFIRLLTHLAHFLFFSRKICPRVCTLPFFPTFTTFFICSTVKDAIYVVYFYTRSNFIVCLCVSAGVLEMTGCESNIKFSGHTLDKATKAKVILENYYSNLVTQHLERKQR